MAEAKREREVVESPEAQALQDTLMVWGVTFAVDAFPGRTVQGQAGFDGRGLKSQPLKHAPHLHSRSYTAARAYWDFLDRNGLIDELTADGELRIKATALVPVARR
jgi:hypothetical protein